MQTKIYKNTFRGCTSLTSMSLPSTVLSIDDCAFQNCTSLKQLSIGSQVKLVGTSAFCGDCSLSSVDRLSDSNPSHTFDIVGDYAFSGTAVKNVKLSLRSSSIYTFWGDGCFQNCLSLEEANVLSANYLSKDMFKGCGKLKKITFNKNMMAYTYPSVFEGCSSLVSVQLPSQLLFIPENMFKDCTQLTSLTFSDYALSNSGITRIEKNAFNGCDSLKEVHFPESIDSLDKIEDAALCAASMADLYLPGIEVKEVGVDKKFPDNIYYGSTYRVTSVDELKRIIELRSLRQVPLLIAVQFKFHFWYSCNHTKDVFLTTLKKGYFDDDIPMDDYNSTFTEGLSAPMAQIDNFTYNNKNYSLSTCKGIVLNAVIDLGDGSGKTVNTLLKNYHNAARTAYKAGDYEYDIVTYLTHLGLAKYSNLTNYKTRGLLGMTTSTTSKLKYFTCETCLLTDSFSKSLYNFTYQGSTDFARKCTALSTAKKVYTGDGLTISDKVWSTNLFRLLDSQEQCKVHCSDDTITVPYNTNPTRYSAPVAYESDKATKTNFAVGKWYYNAKELHKYARDRSTPALFIYSLLGCAPCQIYQSKIWNNASFQEWAKKQKFFLCGMEVTKQPFYDKELSFCVDELSPNAKNFQKIDQGQGTVEQNALFASFYRQRSASGELASNLMTPVLVFMDKNGDCWDYTYHSISKLIDTFSVDGMIQRLKSLCLYHFDNNKLDGAQYVVDAMMPFDSCDYIDCGTNPWQIADDVIGLIKGGITTLDGAIEHMKTQLEAAGQWHDGLYLGGCLFSDIDFLSETYGYELEELTTASRINTELAKWNIKIGSKYYKLVVSSRDKKSIDNPCGMNKMNIFLASFVETAYNG